MTTNAIPSKGVLFKRGDGADPEVFATIGEVYDVSGPGGQASVIPVTHFQSTYVEKLVDVPDEGQITLQCNLVPDDTQQTGLRTDRTNRTLRNFEITLTDTGATKLTFAAYVLGFEVSMPEGDRITASITLEISGAVTWA